MINKRILALGACVSLIGNSFLLPVHADTATDIKDIQATLQKYESRISSLEKENARLSDEISKLKNPTSTTIVSGKTSTGTEVTSGNATYDAVMTRINATLPEILSSHEISSSAVIGTFEFVEPSSVFIAIDDGKNATGVTAFPYKILYKYDKNFNLTQQGFFKLNQEVQLYVTVSGSNPYAKAKRTKVKNPNYKGKLLDETTSTTTSTGS